MIRLTRPNDAGAIAEVHIRKWQSVYRGLLPDGMLDGLSTSLERRTEGWRRALKSPDPGVRTSVAERGGSVVAILTIGPNRDLGPEVGELHEMRYRIDLGKHHPEARIETTEP